MAKRKSSKVSEAAAAARASERRERAEVDPWFGKRRRAGEVGNHRSKAARDKRACRGRVVA